MENLISIQYGIDNEFAATKKAPRLDQFIAEQLPQFSRMQIQKLIENGKVFVDKKVQKVSYRLQVRQTIEITVPLPGASHIEV